MWLPFSITFAAFCCMFAKKRNCGNCAPVYTRARFSHIIDAITPTKVGLFGCGPCVQCFIDCSVCFWPNCGTSGTDLFYLFGPCGAPCAMCVVWLVLWRALGTKSGSQETKNGVHRTQNDTRMTPNIYPMHILNQKEDKLWHSKLFCYILDWRKRTSPVGGPSSELYIYIYIPVVTRGTGKRRKEW